MKPLICYCLVMMLVALLKPEIASVFHFPDMVLADKYVAGLIGSACLFAIAFGLNVIFGDCEIKDEPLR